ncbi:MAG: hypothetical protein ABSC37_06955 [Xanthobacteraceae bacterium]|jgi:hypothetical protein
MRRKKAFKRGRAVSILVAGGIGYLIGGWNATAVRSTDPSAAQTVALRFPQDWNDAPAVEAAADEYAAAMSAIVKGNPQLALFDPEPMVPQAAVPQAAVQLAAAEATGPWPVRQAAPPQPPMPAAAQPASEAKPVQPASEAKPAATLTHHRADREAFMLDDAQIASIKERLHLTPDQERMWPGVEAALRNIAFARAREAHRRGAPVARVQVGAVDPDSVEVQGLKSAAIPLLMSFSAEQKDEVRSLAHVMGLDQLASQF